MPNLAPQSLVAFAKMVSNTGFRSLGEREMTRNISEVADSWLERLVALTL